MIAIAATKISIRQKLSGIFPSITSPFKDGRLDAAKLASNIKRYNEFDLGGYMILGGNGEYLGLTAEEARKAAETITENAKPDRTIIVGVGRESAEATVDFIKAIADLRIDIASVITPYYYAKYMRDENLIAYYKRVADLSPLPIMIYNSPDYAAGITLSTEAVAELSRHPNIIGLKNSSGRPIADYINAVDEKETFVFHSGKAAQCYKDLTTGAIGATLSMAIYWPEICIALYRAVHQGKRAKAQRISGYIQRFNQLGPSRHGVAGVKYAMDGRGLYGGEPRLPLIPLTEAEKARVKLVFEEFQESWHEDSIEM